MTTLADLEQQTAYLLGDPTNTYFTLLQLDDWINRAINDLSVHFPMVVIYTISTTAGAHAYDLETTHKGILSVEYPTNQTPKRFLKRKTFTEYNFWEVPGFYDFIKPNTNDSSNPPQLYVSDHTPASQTITLLCSADHTPLTASADVCTVLDRHIHLIGLFVRWKAYSERGAHDMADPSPLSNRFASMEIAVQRSEQAYRTSLNKAIAAEAESGIVSWKMDDLDRIY